MASRRETLGRLGSLILSRAQKALLKSDTAKAERQGERLGRLLFRLDKKHRERSLANLAIAFPDMAEDVRYKTVLAMYRHFGIVLADFLRSTGRTDEEVLSSMSINPEDLARLEAATAEGKGVLLITAHFGNWERFSHWFRATGRQLAVVARDADDGALQQQVLRIRESNGMRVLSRGSSAREILKVLREGSFVGILPDQNASECFVPFFGHAAGTVKGPAVLHQRTGAPIFPCFCVRTGIGKYQIFTLDLIHGEPDETAESIMARVNLALETAIRQYPEQYLWMHHRWKSAMQRGLF